MSRLSQTYAVWVGVLVFVVGIAMVPTQASAAPPPSHSDLDAKLDQVLQQLGALIFTLPGDGVQGAPLRYQDNGDGTITDLNTGLMWEKKVAGVGVGTCLGALHAVFATCTWAQATGDWINAVNAEGGTGFAGHSDWRLSNVRELQSIADYGAENPAVDFVFNNGVARDRSFGHLSHLTL